MTSWTQSSEDHQLSVVWANKIKANFDPNYTLFRDMS
jgi:hypothetical protein